MTRLGRRLPAAPGPRAAAVTLDRARRHAQAPAAFDEAAERAATPAPAVAPPVAPPPSRPPLLRTGAHHLTALADALDGLRSELPRVERWASHLAEVLKAGGRLLAAGNGGSAAQAQHLTSELVGRYCHDRRPFSAIALHAETSSVTAIGNDYGAEQVFARQVLAHGRTGDVLMVLSTSGRSPNVVAAARAAHGAGLEVWGLTGPRPNPLASACHDAVCVEAGSCATVQEIHLVVVHLLCAAIDVAVGCSHPG